MLCLPPPRIKVEVVSITPNPVPRIDIPVNDAQQTAELISDMKVALVIAIMLFMILILCCYY